MLQAILSQIKLICPACRNQNVQSKIELDTIFQTDREFILSGTLICSNIRCRLRFPIVNGIPLIIREIQSFLASLETKVPGTIEEHVRLRERLETAPGSTNTHSRLLSVYMDAHYGNSADEYEMFRLFRVGDHFWKNALTLIEACNFINALDLGCCVGRYTFELARRSAVAIGIDLNFTYLSAAAKIQRTRQVQWEKSIDGNQYQDQEHQVAVPENVLFVLADAMDPPFEPLSFDITCALNLLDAVSVPLALIAQMDALLKYGGQTILCSPYEWRADITKPEEWLVSPNADSAKIVRQILTGEKFSHLELKYVIDTEIQQVPWLLRNHSRYWSLFLVHMLKAHKM